MYALQLKNLKKTYKNGLDAIKEINLNIEKGDFFALLGANGAGKSTTIGLISSLLPITSGEIIINGHNLKKNPIAAKKCLGIVPQEFNLPIFETCLEVLLNYAGYFGISRQKAMPRADWLLTELGLENKKDAIVYQLSGGMKRRLMIARSLMHHPSVLILDEPSAGVDVEIRHQIWQFLKTINKTGTTIILTTHYLEEAEQLCNHVGILHHGRIIEQAAIQDLLKTQTHQTYIFITKQRFKHLPQMPSWKTSIINETSFEVTLPAETSLNDVFSYLLEHNIEIHSATHKTNRLEALFMELIKDEH